jgi:type II secretory pathway component PulF
MALPIDIGVQVLKHMRMMTKTGSKWEVSNNGDVQVAVINGETMTIALVKARMLPPGDKEE